MRQARAPFEGAPGLTVETSMTNIASLGIVHVLLQGDQIQRYAKLHSAVHQSAFLVLRQNDQRLSLKEERFILLLISKVHRP